MKKKLGEIFAFILLIGSLIAVTVLIYINAPWKSSVEKRVILLTAVANNGVWTTQRVNSINFGYSSYTAANIILEKGEEVVIRLTSADVTHTFYMPELNIGPIEVKAGHIYDIAFKADQSGTFTYYCTTVCGHCHFYMQGHIKILEDGESVDVASTTEDQIIACELDHKTVAKIIDNAFIALGKNLYEDKGCITCHGVEGKGGVKNPYYVNNEVPNLNILASTLKIDWPEDAEVVIDLLKNNTDLNSLEDSDVIGNYNRFLAQYNSTISKIINGADSLQTKDPIDPMPPLNMPAWEHHLSEEEMNSIISYLITLYDWD